VRRPAAHRAGRQRFVPGKARANTVKALVITDAQGRLLFCGQTLAHAARRIRVEPGISHLKNWRASSHHHEPS
jgi:hypothetical protein